MAPLVKYLFLFFLLNLLLMCEGCTKANKNEVKKMDEKSLAARISEIKIMENTKLDSLGEEIKTKARNDTYELIKILHSGNKDNSQKASMVLMSLGDLLISPMISSLDTDDADNYSWEMDVILSAHLENRNKICRILNSMLLDKRQLTGPELEGAVEEKPVPKRVCDEAFLMLRRLIAYNENEEELMSNERIYLDMTNDERDKEIDRFKSSNEWISLSEKMLNEGEF
jgi:hypothetical protein